MRIITRHNINCIRYNMYINYILAPREGNSIEKQNIYAFLLMFIDTLLFLKCVKW